MTLTEHLAKNGAFKTARALLNRRVEGVFGLGLDDLPDTCEVGAIVEGIEALLEDGADTKTVIEHVRSISLEEIVEATF